MKELNLAEVKNVAGGSSLLTHGHDYTILDTAVGCFSAMHAFNYISDMALFAANGKFVAGGYGAIVAGTVGAIAAGTAAYVGTDMYAKNVLAKLA